VAEEDETLMLINNEPAVLIPIGSTWLALSLLQFREALDHGQEIARPTQESQQTPVTAEDRVLDAQGMEAATGVPATWFLDQARRRKIPHMRAGKYVRFHLGEVLDALRVEMHTDRRSVASKTMQRGKRLRAPATAVQPETGRRI
jgi:hypothetical protein